MKAVLSSLILLLAVSSVPAATAPLNDTGSNLCINMATHSFTTICKNTRQDGASGRDAMPRTQTNTDGRLGFSFRKICHSGEPAGAGNCPTNPMLGPETNNWGCTQDLVTGLIWEIKTASGLRKYSKTYTKFDNGANTDASGFVAAVNQQGLCGSQNWRLPTTTELQSIVDYGVMADSSQPMVPVDTKWFPRTLATVHWASNDYVGQASYAWIVSFERGSVYIFRRYNHAAVRLVRTGQ